MEQSYRPSKDTKDSVVIRSGVTTSAGNESRTTIVDSRLTQDNNHWINMAVLILSGNSNGQVRRISAFASGTITVDTAFASQIALGTKYCILGQHAIAAGIGDATLANQLLILGDLDEILDLTRVSADVTVSTIDIALFEDASPVRATIGRTVKVDLSAMVAGDVIILREWYNLKNAGYKQVSLDAANTYYGAQTPAVVTIELDTYLYGCKVSAIKIDAQPARVINYESYVEA